MRYGGGGVGVGVKGDFLKKWGSWQKGGFIKRERGWGMPDFFTVLITRLT